MTPHEAARLQCEHILTHLDQHKRDGTHIISCLEAAGDLLASITAQYDDDLPEWDPTDYENANRDQHEPQHHVWEWLRRENAAHPLLYPNPTT